MVEIIILAIFFFSLYGLISSKNIMKSIVFIVIMEASVILFFLSLGYHANVVPPIGEYPAEIGNIADPLPQALMITAVIVGLATTAVNITIFLTMFRKHHTADWNKVRRLNAAAHADDLGN